MPTYDYRCNACGHTFELFQSMNEAVKRKCPACAKPKLERLIGMGAGILFKGGGFYETDYRSAAYKKDQAAESGSAKPAEPDSKSSTPQSEAKAPSAQPEQAKETPAAKPTAAKKPSPKKKA